MEEPENERKQQVQRRESDANCRTLVKIGQNAETLAFGANIFSRVVAPGIYQEVLQRIFGFFMGINKKIPDSRNFLSNFISLISWFS